MSVVNVGRKAISTFLILASMCFATYAEAEQITVEATGQYIVGDGPDENISSAKERARLDAMRMAAERGGVFVESLSQIVNSHLTKDEVYVITTQIMRIESEKIQPEVEGNSIKYVCKIEAKIDTDSADIESYINNKVALNENIRLKNEIDRLQKENNALKEQYKNALSSVEKNNIAKQFKENEFEIKKAIVEIPTVKDKHVTTTVDSSTINYNERTGILIYKEKSIYGSDMINKDMINNKVVSTMKVDINKNSIQCVDRVYYNAEGIRYKKGDAVPAPIFRYSPKTMTVLKVYQYLDIHPSNMYINTKWKWAYTDDENTNYYVDIANCRYDVSREMMSFPIRRYNENGLYDLGFIKINYGEDLFYYDLKYNRIGVWNDGVDYTAPILSDKGIMMACIKANSLCMTHGRKVFIWEY